MSRGSLCILATCASILFASVAVGQFGGRGGGGGHGGGGQGRDAGPSDPARSMKPPPPQIVLTPHGGEYLQTEAVQYEVVYMPLQTRIYLFDKKLKPLSARDVHAQMSLTLPTESNPRQIPFRYAAMPPGATEQDFVFAVFDLRQLQDHETPITFEFSGLPDRHHPIASFTPLFSSERIRPFVARVLPIPADRDGVMRQRVCPVSGQALGARGPIVKLYLGDFPLYLSGEDCIAAVQQSPERYLPRPAAARPSSQAR
ncbi:MAG: hypothetical protein WCB27_19165 [Thermoguttaceae bacterium]